MRVDKTKPIPGFGVVVGLHVWIYTHLPESTQQILAYVGVGSVNCTAYLGAVEISGEARA